MFRRFLLILSTLVFAAGILSVSLLRSSEVSYSFSLPAERDTAVLGESDEVVNINYHLAYPGKVLPDHPLWPLKALRDRLWLLVSAKSEKKAELSLLFADKRLGAAKELFASGKPEIAFATLTKAEKYLEEVHPFIQEADERGVEVGSILTRLANASLKHREVIDEILLIAPADAKPEIAKVQDYSKESFKKARDTLNSKGLPVPENPFETE